MTTAYRTWADIDLEALSHNLRVIKERCGAAQLWPVLKGDAYGHGAPQIARHCAREGVAKIGVGDSGEALELRESGVQLPMLVLGTVIDAEVPLLLHHDVEVGVHSHSRVRQLAEEARRAGRRMGVHLKVDTGMGRLGVQPEAVRRVAEAICEASHLEFRGLMSHFAAPLGCLDPFTEEQRRRFQACLAHLQEHRLPIPAIHLANSAALFTGLHPLGQAARPGLALYGTLAEALDPNQELQPVLSLRAQIIFLKDVPTGTPVGYGSRWTAPRPTRLAILPIGYADGLPYALSRQSEVPPFASFSTESTMNRPPSVSIRGRLCPIVGALSMDYTAVDVTEVTGADIGDPVTLIGRDGEQNLPVQQMAAAAGTIPYEITCRLGKRVRRVYHFHQQAWSSEQAVRS
ncbi:MAG: alanine racemase [Planctomycetota bacterium]|nr:MAG: alanine racemase [Planctomycetota bacterium]